MRLIRKIISASAAAYIVLVLIAYLPTETVPIRELAGKDSRFLQTAGHTIHYIKQGHGRPLVLVHGFGGSSYTWRSLAPLLQDDCTVYALDLLGFGLSDKPPDGEYALDAQAELVVDFMKELQISSAVLIGHSMGGVIAAKAAAQNPLQARFFFQYNL